MWMKRVPMILRALISRIISRSELKQSAHSVCHSIVRDVAVDEGTPFFGSPPEHEASLPEFVTPFNSVLFLQALQDFGNSFNR